MEIIEVLLFQSHIQDKKHGLEFDKDKISYKHKTFDAVLSHEFKDVITAAMVNKGLKFPLILKLREDDYFMKAKKYKKADGTQGVKQRITIMRAQSVEQGKFESKSLDDVCNDIDASIQAGMQAYGEVTDVDDD